MGGIRVLICGSRDLLKGRVSELLNLCVRVCVSFVKNKITHVTYVMFLILFTNDIFEYDYNLWNYS